MLCDRSSLVRAYSVGYFDQFRLLAIHHFEKICLTKIDPPPLSVEVKVHGKEESKCLVFIHGWSDSAALWNGVTEKLKVKYRCVVLTLPGFSGSEKDHWGYDFSRTQSNYRCNKGTHPKRRKNYTCCPRLGMFICVHGSGYPERCC